MLDSRITLFFVGIGTGLLKFHGIGTGEEIPLPFNILHSDSSNKWNHSGINFGIIGSSYPKFGPMSTLGDYIVTLLGILMSITDCSFY